jgi:hypothetical protein
MEHLLEATATSRPRRTRPGRAGARPRRAG